MLRKITERRTPYKFCVLKCHYDWMSHFSGIWHHLSVIIVSFLEANYLFVLVFYPYFSLGYFPGVIYCCYCKCILYCYSLLVQFSALFCNCLRCCCWWSTSENQFDYIKLPCCLRRLFLTSVINFKWVVMATSVHVCGKCKAVVRCATRLRTHTEHNWGDSVGLGSLIEVCSQQRGSKICISPIAI